jgi:hypothetical protein
MKFEELLTKYGVTAIRRLNDKGFIQVGMFRNFHDAEHFVEEAKTIPGCLTPAVFSTSPSITVMANIGKHSDLFRRLEPITIHPAHR